VNEREDLAHRLAEKVAEKKRNATDRALGLAKKSAFGDTPNRIRKAMGKTPESRSAALNVSIITFQAWELAE
jgi:DNA-binding transcriptional regulator YiaG